MKTLYRKGTVHPSPPQQQPPTFSDPLAFLPAAILTLAAALTVEDREVLAYLLSCSSAATNHQSPSKKKGVKPGGGGGGDHSPAFNCNCFRCYMSYWVRWDASPNRQLIHEIIDAFEDWILAKNKKSGGGNRGGRRERKKKGMNGRDLPEIDRVSEIGFPQGELGMPEPAEDGAKQGGELEESDGACDGDKGGVRKLVSLIGERIWSVWG